MTHECLELILNLYRLLYLNMNVPTNKRTSKIEPIQIVVFKSFKKTISIIIPMIEPIQIVVFKCKRAYNKRGLYCY